MSVNSKLFEDILLAQALSLFRAKYHCDPEVCAIAPGRANFIGEHTDYNEGFVLPFALPYATMIVASKRANSTSRIVSGAFPDEMVEFKIDATLSKGTPEWANYVKGVIYQYIAELPEGCSFDAAIVSNVPLGSGLSSSAALEVSTATVLEGLYELRPDGVQKALKCQKAEHTFAGMPCGIMDQYISSMGQAGNLLLIDCKTNDFKLVPFGDDSEDTPVIVVTNSNVKHQLTGSEYPDRVKQCQEAVKTLQTKYLQVLSLRDATVEMLDAVKDSMEEVVYRRAKHVIDENARTLNTVEALKAKDYEAAGVYMTQSHHSLRDDYEVSCEELDFLVNVASHVSGVYGSRMTGGGFGGCTVTLVKKSAVKELEKYLHEHYFKQYHIRCDCYEALPSAGARLLDIQSAIKQEDQKMQAPWLDYLVPGLVVILSVGVGLSFFLQRK